MTEQWEYSTMVERCTKAFCVALILLQLAAEFI
jgi:hypothetical protein